MSKILLTWEEFLYELSSLGFNYSKDDHAWHRADGAMASDEALRDIHELWPAFSSAALKLWNKGARHISIEVTWENKVFVARLRAVE